MEKEEIQFNKKEWRVEPIPGELCKDWFLYKHYAHRIPPTVYCFGLYRNKILEGVCSFGMPCVQMNDGKCIFHSYRVRTLELNRLIVNEGLGKNVLSFFVSWAIKQLPRPLCLVSFADPFNGHQGYIYQATNWLYTGKSQVGGKNKTYILDGRNYHGKTITEQWVKDTFGKYDSSKSLTQNFEMNGGKCVDFGTKHRYIMFLGTTEEIEKMKRDTVYHFIPYPKGENKRYDASYKIKSTAQSLF